MRYYRRKKKRHIFLRLFLTLIGCGAFAAVCAVMLPVDHIVERIKYELAGSGLEVWEQSALESGIDSAVEEYYYAHLPEKLQETYRELYVKIMCNEDSGNVLSSISVDDFWKTYYAVLADHPEIFWIGMSAQIEESGFTKQVISYELESIVPVEERQAMRERLEAAADACVEQISEDASVYQKIRFVYEYIIDRTDYGRQSADSQNIQSVLLEHSSVCAGYSKAFQYILNRMGIFCTYITGTIRDGGDHGWNMVRIDEEYYYVDVTWGDPVFANEIGETQESTINYNYLCCTEEDLFKTHVPSDWIELPACTSDAYDYYKLNGFYYENFDRETIYQALMNSVWNAQSEIVMKFGSSEAYEAAKTALFEGDLLSAPGEYLMEINGVKTWNYRYHTEEDFCLITIYW